MSGGEPQARNVFEPICYVLLIANLQLVDS